MRSCFSSTSCGPTSTSMHSPTRSMNLRAVSGASAESMPSPPAWRLRMLDGRRLARRALHAPSDMMVAPVLPPPRRGGAVQDRAALLLNPFYPKDPRASFGKHVLTPTLALTSIAGATPAHWRVSYWDENLLQGPPPSDPPPPVV